ncbi:hypothetical protein L1987_64044 [Smallanthus sonchifolius]|uniref:Uncharacterized protein n=1 Tax=Smallanthus sonchifolius TaxID=185202 RepID=A0ACB9CF03_9ASTR|nr:hypothetical protein L1987_64044 [Smallanthus sonchifolius]
MLKTLKWVEHSRAQDQARSCSAFEFQERISLMAGNRDHPYLEFEMNEHEYEARLDVLWPRRGRILAARRLDPAAIDASVSGTGGTTLSPPLGAGCSGFTPYSTSSS